MPRLPEWPGRDSFAGELIHSAAYRNAEPFQGRDVLVVGSGNSGAEIAVDLADNGAGRVRIAVRTPPQIAKRAALGIPTHVVGIALGKLPPELGGRITSFLRRVTIPDLSAQGLPRPTETLGAQFARTGTIPILDVGFVAAVRDGRIEIVKALEGFDGRDVVLADGARIQPEVVIAATGFRPGIEPLVGHLGVLDEQGFPRADEPEPGLHLFGYAATLGGTIRLLALEAPRLVERVAVRGRAGAASPAPAAPESGRTDSNCRPLRPKRSALTRLSYVPEARSLGARSLGAPSLGARSSGTRWPRPPPPSSASTAASRRSRSSRECRASG